VKWCGVVTLSSAARVIRPQQRLPDE